MPFLKPVSRLYVVNPFERAWDRLLREAVGSGLVDGVSGGASLEWGPLGDAKDGLSKPLASLLDTIAERLRAGVVPAAEEIEVYRGAAVYRLWDRFGAQLQQVVDEDGVEVSFYDDFVHAYRTLFDLPGLSSVVVPEPAHFLAILYQARRACRFIAQNIAGRSDAARKSRAAIWRAIFGSDVRTYASSFYRRMDERPVLITGETGTGKDLAAKCIGWSRYVRFDPATRSFAARYAEDFHARSLVEVSAELTEAALFGYKKGSFTGAHEDRPGCLGLPQANGLLFLDEIGEIPLQVQAKLLRPFQNREFVPLGETRPRPIHGRLVFATHRDLEAMIQRGEFRADLYERMNGLRVHMPSLREMRPDGGLLDYVDRYVGAHVTDPELRCMHVLRVMRVIQDTLADYEWPRNQRELKNYVDRVLVEGTGEEAEEVAPPEPAPDGADTLPPESLCVPSSGILGGRAKAGEVDWMTVLTIYVTTVYARTGMNKAETARRTRIDRRALSRWIDPVRLARLLGESKLPAKPADEKRRPPNLGGLIRPPRRR
jgi:hypothetical protein